MVTYCRLFEVLKPKPSDFNRRLCIEQEFENYFQGEGIKGCTFSTILLPAYSLTLCESQLDCQANIKTKVPGESKMRQMRVTGIPWSTGKSREGTERWCSMGAAVIPGGACDRGTTPGALHKVRKIGSSKSG